ncbi:hypothetical protein [Pseudomonas weihenstephanensis]|uniref:hypothetical protein n=1 Tax=Pseudomonas weihenstephanensis TaxID=1608994 RepID=UPI00193BACF8|nr:hypothetical protein [Pseudomonas weihenstephanensis]MBM1189349.1 hypothetical protein [Pseudomonas weihenstephanensis]
MNSIEQALSQSQQTTAKRKGFTAQGGGNFQAQRQLSDYTGSNGFAEGMANFVKNSGAAYGAMREQQQQTADERSNEIIRKLSPEQRRSAIADGTLLYKDDPDAMNQLRLKSGRNAAYQVDSEIQQEIQKGTFRTRKDLDEYRQTRMEMVSKSYAEDAGIDPNDTLYQKGFNTDITNRNAAVYDLHGQWISKNFEAQSVVETRADTQPMLDDPKVMSNPASAQWFSNYINTGLQSGLFPSDHHAIQAIQQVASEAVNKEGGTTLLDNLGDQTLNVYGAQHRVKDLLGPEVYENLRVKAMGASYTRDSKRNETFQLGITNAINQVDPAAGWQMLNKLEQGNDWLQAGPEMTPQRQMLIDAKSQLSHKVAQSSQQGLVKLQQAAQADNRQLVIDDAYTRRMNGENVSVDPKFLPVNENTGEMKASDMATYAAKKLGQVDALQIPDDQKDAMKASLLRADYDKGPFQAAFGTLITDASREWQGALISPEPAGDMPRLKELQRAYQADPATISQLFPDQAGLLEKLRYSAESGIDPQVLIDAEKSKKGLSQDEQKYRNEQWASIKNDSNAKELKFLPGAFETQARAVFDAVTLRSGDSNEASRAVSDYLKKTTVSFVEDNGWNSSNSFHGMISKRDLMVDPNDSASWETGKAHIDETMQALRKDSEWGGGGMTVESKGGALYISNMIGKRMRISREDMQKHAQEKAATAQQKRFDDGVKSAERINDLHERWILGGARKQ